mmetsp:Transcript_12060/g.27332  ORF Transcript_12060/g.27332 Transcript_12060/m.27332 type:complete len:275 (-) Transcript_12060:34-858(-)
MNGHGGPRTDATAGAGRTKNLGRGVELGGEHLGEPVDVVRVGDVLGPVLDGALARDDGLDVEAEHGEHGEAPVLDLLDLELSEGVRVVGEAEWVEALTRVELVESLSGWASVHPVGLGESHEDNLAGEDGHDGLGVDEGWVSEVVESSVLEDEGSLLEPWVRGEGRVSGELWSDASEGTEHSPSGVDELSLSVGGEGLWVSRETGGVPAVVTRVLTLEVGWAGVVGVRSEPLGAVWAVPHGGPGDHAGGGLGGLGAGELRESSDGKSHGSCCCC